MVYRELSQIRIDEFEKFLRHDINIKNEKKKKVVSTETFKNKYSHLRAMLRELKKQQYIPSHNFEEKRDKLIERFENITIEKDTSFLNEANIETILRYIGENDNALRNKVIFLFCIYMGLERSSLVDLKINMIKDNKIIFGSRKIPLPRQLCDLISQLILENSKKKIRGIHLFYSKYDGKFSPMKENTVNYVFNSFSKIDESNVKWKVFSPQYIRNNLIKRLYKNNYTIEEISYLTGMDLHNISKLISLEALYEKVNLTQGTRARRKHPFEKFLM